MELFAAGARLANLEVLHGVCAVGYCLPGEFGELAWAFDVAVRHPVLVARCLFHEHPWFAVSDSTHQVVAHVDGCRVFAEARVGIPADHVEQLTLLVVVVIVECSHHVGGDRSICVISTYGIAFELDAFAHLLVVEVAVV